MDPRGIAWSRDGKQIYYRDTAEGLMAVDVRPQGGEFHSGLPKQIFSSTGGTRLLDTAPDGKILVMVQADQGMAPPLTLVVNWDAEMK